MICLLPENGLDEMKCLAGGLVLLAMAGSSSAAAQQADTAQGTGRAAGRVVDAETGRPVVNARITVAGAPGTVETDLDGRFRTGPIPVGIRALRAVSIGYKPQLIDSVRITAGQATVVNFALQTNPVQLEEISVTSEQSLRASSASGLLAAQQAAPAVSDGVSAETIGKTPDSDASAAVARVTGVSVLNDKVVVRGLGERYSTALLNGVEIASPEPDKKFVPMDVFPSSLLEALVASKSATPDKPGDFAGGTVDIQTKEFPDNRVVSVAVSQGYNSRSTFRSFTMSPRSGWDFLGFNGNGRGFPAPNGNPERYAEGFSNVWTPAASRALPDLGIDASVGGRKDLGDDALGYVISFNYNRARDYNPDKFSHTGNDQYIGEESAYRVDLSGLFNLSYRLGASHKFGFKNFYTRGSSDDVRRWIGTNLADLGADESTLNYQLRFVERYVAQSQLTGDHYLPFLLHSRFEWKGSYGWAGRDDLDNRQLTYLQDSRGLHLTTARPLYRTNTELRDRSWSTQGDWSIPVTLRSRDDALIKFGGAYRRKNRDFDGVRLRADINPTLVGTDILDLPPERLFAPENLGADGILYSTEGNTINPYIGTERVTAGYGMVDFELFPRLRVVGGVRFERWFSQIDVRNPTSDPTAGGTPIPRREDDLLWSANLTYVLSNRINIRAAAYRTRVRPDLRELAPGGYSEVLGDCFTYGNPNLRASGVDNGDVRFEVYPGSNELLAVSGFYKRFDHPIVTALEYAGNVICRPRNGERAENYGVELEARKSLRFLAAKLEPLLASANVSLIRSRITMPASLGAYPGDLKFQGQSPYLINLGLTYSPLTARLSASVLFNRYGERIVLYGVNTGANQAPNYVELPRSTLDAKLKVGVFRVWSLSLSGKNLLDSPIEWRDDRPQNDASTERTLRLRSRIGRSFSLGLSYAP